MTDTPQPTPADPETVAVFRAAQCMERWAAKRGFEVPFNQIRNSLYDSPITEDGGDFETMLATQAHVLNGMFALMLGDDKNHADFDTALKAQSNFCYTLSTLQMRLNARDRRRKAEEKQEEEAMEKWRRRRDAAIRAAQSKSTNGLMDSP